MPEPTAADAAAAAAAALGGGSNNGGNTGDAAGGVGTDTGAGADKSAGKGGQGDGGAGDAGSAGGTQSSNAGSETPEQKAAREAAERAGSTNVVPDKYDLKLPDGVDIEPAVVERTAAIARELGLSQERAQKMLDFHVQEVTAMEEAAIAATLDAHKPGGAVWDKQVGEWNAAALADPELGGNKPEQLEASVKLAKTVVAKYGDKESIAFLETNPLGSHPALLRLLARIGKASSEGSFVMPRSQDAAKKSTAEILYGDDAPKVAGV